FDVLGDPVRRRILELLAEGQLTSGAITAVVQDEFGISQPAVSQHLRVLRESGFATVRPEGTRRLYAVADAPFRDIDDWLGPLPGVRRPPATTGSAAAINSRATPAARSSSATGRTACGRRGPTTTRRTARSRRSRSGWRPPRPAGGG